MREAAGPMHGKVEPLERDTLLAALQTLEPFLFGIFGGRERFVTVDPEWRVTFVNAAALADSGLEEDDLLGGDLRRLASTAFPRLDLTALERAMREREPAGFESATEGGAKTLRGAAYPLADGGLAVLAGDVSARARTEETRDRHRREAEQERLRLQAVLDGVPAALWIVDAAGRTVYSNEEARSAGRGAAPMAERVEGGVAGTTWEATTGEPVAAEHLPLARALRGETVDQLELTYERVDGSRGTQLVSARPIRCDEDVTGAVAVAQDVTERKRIERSLRESEQLLSTVLSYSRDGINMLDLASGRYVFMNEAQVALTGFTQEEINGISAEEAYARVHPDDRDISVEQQRRVAAGEDVDELVEYRWRVKSGEYRWFRDRRKLVRDDEGRPVALVGVSRDVTDQKAAERTLRGSEERYRQLFASESDAIFLIDQESGRILEANPAAAELYGYEPGELLGLTDLDLSAEPELTRAATRSMTPGGSVKVSLRRHVRKDGGLLEVEVTARVFSLDGRPVRIAAVRDVSQRLRAEKALLETRERLQLAVEAAGIGTFDLDFRTGVDVWSPELETMHGLEPGEFGKTQAAWERLIHEDDRPAATALIAETLETGEPVQGEWRVVWPDGSVHWISGRFQGFKDESGEPLRLTGVNMDVTARKETEAALLEHESERAAREERVRLARDLHDSMTQALFAATLRAEALAVAGGDGPPPVAAAVEDVRRLNRGALAQMRTMLLELRGDPVADVPLRQLLRHLVETAEGRASVKVTLSIDGEAGLPPRIHEAVYRIAQEALNNVARHAKAENAWVRLRAEDGQARLTVGDDGRGFDPASVGPGHFGLTSMRERAKETGGQLLVTSAAGDGTLVTADWQLP